MPSYINNLEINQQSNIFLNIQQKVDGAGEIEML